MKIADVLFPPKCIVCGKLIERKRIETPFCEDCSADFEDMKSLCRYESFGQPVAVYSSANEDDEFSGHTLFSVYYVPGKRDLPANRLMYRLKNRGERRCVRYCADILAEMLKSEAEFLENTANDAIITWIPRRCESVLKYGFDHMHFVAIQLGKILSISVRKIIRRRLFSSEQKTLSVYARRDNVQNSFYIPKSVSLNGRTVILIDDIITTGASIDAASALLREHGAGFVISAAVAKSEHPTD